MGESGADRDWPYSLVEGISPVEALDAGQRELFRGLAAEHSDLDDDVAVYWLKDGTASPPRAVVAPVSSRVKTGDKVIAAGWTAIAQDVWLDPETGDFSSVALLAAGRLVRVH